MSLLQLNELKELDVVENDWDMLVWAEVAKELLNCPYCGGKVYKHRKQEQDVKDSPIRKKRVAIAVKRNRYKCIDCTKTFNDEIKAFDSVRKITLRLRDEIREECLSKSFADIAIRVGVKAGTIRNVFEDYDKELAEQNPVAAPRILGIEEIKLGKSKQLLLTNIEAETLFDIIHGSKRDEQLQELSSKIHNNVKIIVLDTLDIEVAYIKQYFPHAKIIIDKYHIVRKMNDYYKRLQSKVNAEELRKVRDLQQQLNCFWNCEDIEEARSYFHAWKTALYSCSVKIQRFFKGIPELFEQSEQEIYDYFNNRYSNRYAEMLEKTMQKIANIGTWYSFAVLRANVLYKHPKRELPPSHFALDELKEIERTSPEDALMFMVTDINYGIDVPKLIQKYEEK